MKNCFQTSLTALAAGLLAVNIGCQRTDETRWQGYIEGEFVYVASPLAGRLEQLDVARGDRIAAGAPLFQLERAAEIASREEAAQRVAQAEARLADLRKGQRPTEIAALEARLEQARTAARMSGLELERISRLYETRVVSTDDHDRVRLSHERNEKVVAELDAQLATARLGARADAVSAAEAETSAARAALERADWNLAQKTQSAPEDALVYDTLFRRGEFVPAATPVVALLPPANIKVRFFVPEPRLADIKPGRTVKVAVSGRTEPIDARVSFISPTPEFTPPVLYNRENRAKLVFMVEAFFPPATAVELHPGQPVDVTR